MNKIAILVCNKLTYKCSGSGCFNAFNKKIEAFEIYKNTETELKAFFHCNGCNSNLEQDLEHKINQLKKHEVNNVHMALCIKVECSRYDEIKNFIENKGFTVIHGSHK